MTSVLNPITRLFELPVQDGIGGEMVNRTDVGAIIRDFELSIAPIVPGLAAVQAAGGKIEFKKYGPHANLVRIDLPNIPAPIVVESISQALSLALTVLGKEATI